MKLISVVCVVDHKYRTHHTVQILQRSEAKEQLTTTLTGMVRELMINDLVIDLEVSMEETYDEIDEGRISDALTALKVELAALTNQQLKERWEVENERWEMQNKTDMQRLFVYNHHDGCCDSVSYNLIP